MKKLFAVIILSVLVMPAAMAQVPDSVIRNQKEQEMLERQRKEQESLQKEQDKIQKEQEQLQRDQERERQKAEKERKRAERKERRAQIGRSTGLSIDPFIGLSFPTRTFKFADPCHHTGFHLGAGVAIHYPLNKKFDFNLGVGYRATLLTYTNDIVYNPATEDFAFRDYDNHYSGYAMSSIHTLQVPITLSYVKKDKNDRNKYFYFGLNIGYNFATQFNVYQLDQGNSYKKVSAFSTENPLNLKNWRCDLLVGVGRSRFLFRPTIQLYFNLLPTYIDGVNNGNPIHEFGLTLSL